MIDNKIVKQIIDEVNIVDVVSEYLPLTQKGKGFWGVCPFHHDTNPSMSVSAEKKMFKCFSCNTGGDVISFVSKFEQISFQEAVVKLAKRIGITINLYNDPESEKKKIYYDAMEEAANFYEFYLKNSKEGLAALKYLHERGISDEIISKFRIGLAPNGTNYLHLALNEHKIDMVVQNELGLVSQNAQGEIVDSFRNRIMFPITNHQGSVCAFSGRIFNSTDKTAKYINSIENPIFRKSDILYNFKNASLQARSLNKMYVFEGFMDVIAAYKAGVTNSVATMGTALTRNHIKSLLGICDNIILCFDGDLAGINATKKANLVFSEFNVMPTCVALPEGLDPDDFLKKYGADALNNALSTGALNVYDYLFKVAVDNLMIDDVKSVENCKQEVFSFLRGNVSKTSVEFYLNKLSEILNISLESLMGDFGSVRVEHTPNTEDNIPTKVVTRKRNKIPNKVFKAYETIIKCVLQDKKLYLEYVKVIDLNIPNVELIPYYTVLLQIGDYYNQNNNLNAVDFVENYYLTDPDRELINKIISKEEIDANNIDAFRQCLKTLYNFFMDDLKKKMLEDVKNDYDKYDDYLMLYKNKTL